MVYKRYARKNGKVYGPYYYESYRENGVVKKLYIGQKSSPDVVVPRRNFPVFGVLVSVLIVLAFLAGFVLLSSTGKVVLQTEPSYNLNESLGGQAILNLEEGDSIQKDTQIKLILSKDEVVLSERTLTFEEFLGNQTDYVEITSESSSCENITISEVQEVCEEQINENNESVQVCMNQTVETIAENCTTINQTDYYYQTSGSYSRDIQ